MRLKRTLHKKGFIEMAAPFAIIMFLAIAVIIFGLLGLMSSRERQTIGGKLLGTDIDETLYVYLASDTGKSNFADMVVDAVNSKDFTELDKATTEFFADHNYIWAIFITDSASKHIHTMSKSETYRKETLVEFEKRIIFKDKLSGEQIIPNPEGDPKNIKVTLYKIGKGEWRTEF